ncbi:hypothetical protein L596_007988 [Steinernema carpocapsae]|uniref:Uncharacterized protein n=1 Tax=Steinernema carpocapsae TaxID=34508 RepID=A0A4U5PBL9_STECR|nr:hypothetical protein L596_007988 [Steinernema carpocapsae]
MSLRERGGSCAAYHRITLVTGPLPGFLNFACLLNFACPFPAPSGVSSRVEPEFRAPLPSRRVLPAL